MSLRALICDDKPARVSVWKDKVEAHTQAAGWRVETKTGDELASIVIALSNADRSLQSTRDNDLLTEIGDYDLVILDSDLSADPQDLVGVSPELATALRNQYGDEVARQIRTHTSAGFIVVVNMFTGRDSSRVFDLTMQQDAGTYADLHIGEDDLADHHLWTGSIAESYAPWSRPRLAHAHEWVRRSEEAIPDLDREVLSDLGLDSNNLATRQLDVFGPVEPESATYKSLAYSKLGFKYADGHDAPAERRMAASVLRRWLARTVISAQDELVDTPHLIARVPHLMSEVTEGVRWPELVKDWEAGVLPAAEISLKRSLEPYTDRAVYDIKLARTIPPGAGVAGPALVFLEDASVFAERKAAVEIETDVPGRNFRRFVQPPPVPGVQYEPFTRLLR